MPTPTVPLDDLVALYRQGRTPAQIADELGLNRINVSKRLAHAGHRTRGRLPDAPELQHLLASETAATIAERYGVQVESVYTKLRDARARGDIPPVVPMSGSIRTIDPDTRDLDWDTAPCAPALDLFDPDEFFPNIPTGFGAVAKARAVTENMARRACAHCPLRQPCYQGALERREPAGIWGGVLFDNGKPFVRGAA